VDEEIVKIDIQPERRRRIGNRASSRRRVGHDQLPEQYLYLKISAQYRVSPRRPACTKP